METAATTAYATEERLEHLGIVAGVCPEIGLAEFLDAQAAGSRQKVSVGTATVAMVLNGLGFSNRRRLYLVPQFFENKPLERLLGVPGIEALDLLVGCLAESRRPTGFAFGETVFQVLVLNASRRLQADRFYTTHYTEEVYTPERLEQVEKTTMKDLLRRHYPELRRTGLPQAETAFHPWSELVAHP